MRKFKITEYVAIGALLMASFLIFEGQYSLLIPYIYSGFSFETQIVVTVLGLLLMAAVILFVIKRELFSDMSLNEPYKAPYHYIKKESKRKDHNGLN